MRYLKFRQWPGNKATIGNIQLHDVTSGDVTSSVAMAAVETTEWGISLLVSTNMLRKQSSALVRPPFL